MGPTFTVATNDCKQAAQLTPLRPIDHSFLNAPEVLLISHPFFHRYARKGTIAAPDLRKEQAHHLGTIFALEVVAELKVELAIELARQNQLPLIVTLPQSVLEEPRPKLSHSLDLLLDQGDRLRVLATGNDSGQLTGNACSILGTAGWRRVYLAGGYVSDCLTESASALPALAQLVFLETCLIADIPHNFRIRNPRDVAEFSARLESLSLFGTKKLEQLQELCADIVRSLVVHEESFIEEELRRSAAGLSKTRLPALQTNAPTQRPRPIVPSAEFLHSGKAP